jgi:hypothetical protein
MVQLMAECLTTSRISAERRLACCTISTAGRYGSGCENSSEQSLGGREYTSLMHLQLYDAVRPLAGLFSGSYAPASPSPHGASDTLFSWIFGKHCASIVLHHLFVRPQALR